ncbi:hypothetical protein GSI_15600 [Ganoderma sinense ZZ0214-1]|uniref:Uncharacterized protein n=1 Tax=Ganoderma sinense ZZ0214-1 TaxID=1077348 RepID=A0A2G8RN15_9APHY|nr:hypothetical protein GSI_15600 [Ganoderma sinense ZZ0214-1]
MSKDTSIQVLTSRLDGLTLEELRNGPDLASEHASSPALEYPDRPPLPELEAGKPNDTLCYVLGWLKEDVSKQMMRVAGLPARQQGDLTYEQNFAQALHYMRQKSNYAHIWTTYEYVPGEDTNAPDAIGGPGLLAVCCSVDEVYHCRPSKGQFEWIKKVVGMEPRWYLIERSSYTVAESHGVWGPKQCCPLREGDKCHLVDLDTGKWVRDLE